MVKAPQHICRVMIQPIIVFSTPKSSLLPLFSQSSSLTPEYGNTDISHLCSTCFLERHVDEIYRAVLRDACIPQGSGGMILGQNLPVRITHMGVAGSDPRIVSICGVSWITELRTHRLNQEQLCQPCAGPLDYSMQTMPPSVRHQRE